MAFTFTNYPILTKEQQNPMQALITNALDTYQKGIKTSNMPRQIEADIFAKEIGPLAALASNPNFTGFNPEVQKMIAGRIGKYLGAGRGGETGEEGGENTPPGYASGEDIFKRLESGAKVTLSPGGQSKLTKSSIAGYAEKAGVPAEIVKLFGGNKVAGQNADFQQALREAARNLKLRGYSDQEAAQILKPRIGENDKNYLKRIKPLLVSKNKQKEIDKQEQINEENFVPENAQPEGAIVFMRTPDGKEWPIAADKVEEAIKRGATRVE